MKKSVQDYSRYLVLYSGGADSTYFVEKESSAKHLIFFEGKNSYQARIAVTNANLLNRHLNYVNCCGSSSSGGSHDGETNEIHALYDTEMALQASIKAISFGMKGIVMCFNKDDIGIEYGAIEKIMQRVDKDFEIVLPLIDMTERGIRQELKKSSKLRTVSCMNENECGFCAKCLKKASH